MFQNSIRASSMVCLIVLAAAAAAPTWAACPAASPQRLVLKTTAGGAADTVARALAQQMLESSKRTVVIEYRAGGGGLIGATAVTNAPADGCTIVMATNQYIMLPLLRPELKAEAFTNLVPVASLGAVPDIWLARNDAPFKTVPELLAYAQKNPGKVNFSSGGTGSVSHLLPLAFRKQGIEMNNVPFGGQAQALNALLGGHVDFLIEPVVTGIAHVKAGKVRALLTTGLERSKSLPDVPTLKEIGMPFRAVSVFGFMVAPGTPPAVVDQLNAELNLALTSEVLRQTLLKMEFSIETGPPSVFAGVINDERRLWGEVVRQNNIKGE